MASTKQIYYANGLIGKALVSGKVTDKGDLWDKIGLLPETTMEDLDNKEMSDVISKLNDLTKE